MSTREVVVMVATSYPRFPGDGVGSFMEPIAKGVAALGHEVHMVAPWHPAITRGKVEDGVYFHFFKYAPVSSLNVFGYASGLKADTALKSAAWVAAPAAFAAGAFKAWRVSAKKRATVMHGHWVIPGGVIAQVAAGALPLVISLHGSDVFVAERHSVLRTLARRAFARAGAVTACSDDLHQRAIRLGAEPTTTVTVPYGVDVTRFAPDESARRQVRESLGVREASPLVVSAGRLVSKKGFEFLIEATRHLRATLPDVCVAIAGGGDLEPRLRELAAGLPVRVLGNKTQDEVSALVAAADIVAVPSIRDDAGNVDGLPNFALEALASATPVVATTAGGLPQAITNNVNGRLVPERDSAALAAAIAEVWSRPDRGKGLGEAARARVVGQHSWRRTAEQMVEAYATARRGAARR